MSNTVKTLPDIIKTIVKHNNTYDKCLALIFVTSWKISFIFFHIHNKHAVKYNRNNVKHNKITPNRVKILRENVKY